MIEGDTTTGDAADARRLQSMFEFMEDEAMRLGLVEVARIAGIGALAASDAAAARAVPAETRD